MSLHPVAHDWDFTELTSVADALRVFADLRGRAWLCRGQSKCHGGLVPSIDRGPLQGLDRIQKLTLERQSIDLFRSTVRFFSDPGEQSALSSDIGALMVLRHHDVPTRLLDWSLSPYVAAYFSVCDNDSENGEIWSFNEPLYEKKGREQWTQFPETTIDGSGDPSRFDSNLTAAFSITEPSDWFVCHFYPGGFPRQRAQNGAYSFTPRFDRDHAGAIAKLLEDPSHYHLYIVSARLKRDLLTELREKHGIWRGSLFPDVAGAAAVARTVFPNGV
jgi:hypothetical protein